MTYMKPLGKFQHSREKRSKPRASQAKPTPEPTLPTNGRCDGYEAGRLLAQHGPEAAEYICERVARFGGRP